MIDKKTNETIDKLIEKLKDNNLGSIKLSNKNNTIEITNISSSNKPVQENQNISSNVASNNKIDNNESFLSIDSPMVGIIYLTLNRALLLLQKKVKK